jgi:hypothetical protein
LTSIGIVLLANSMVEMIPAKNERCCISIDTSIASSSSASCKLPARSHASYPACDQRIAVPFPNWSRDHSLEQALMFFCGEGDEGGAYIEQHVATAPHAARTLCATTPLC